MWHDQSGIGPDGARRNELIAGISARPRPAIASAALGQRRREIDFIMEALLRDYMAPHSRPGSSTMKFDGDEARDRL